MASSSQHHPIGFAEPNHQLQQLQAQSHVTANGTIINGSHHSNGNGNAILTNAFSFGAPIAPLALQINNPSYFSNSNSHQLLQHGPLPATVATTLTSASFHATPSTPQMSSFFSPEPSSTSMNVPIRRPSSSNSASVASLSSSSQQRSTSSSPLHVDAAAMSAPKSSSKSNGRNGNGKKKSSAAPATPSHTNGNDDVDEKEDGINENDTNSVDGDDNAEREAYLHTMKPFGSLSDVMLTRKMAEHLPSGDVHRAVSLVRHALLKLKPVKLNGKTQGRLEWSLPPVETRPLPSLLTSPGMINSQSPLRNSKRHTRILPIKCWTITDLSFKSITDAASSTPLPAYSASKHLFFIELINTCQHSLTTSSSSSSTNEKKKAGRTRVPGLRPKGEQESGQQSVTLTGRLKSGGGEEVGHIQFSAAALRYQFPLSQLFTDMHPSSLSSSSSRSSNGMESDDDSDDHREKGSKEAAERNGRSSINGADRPEPSLLVDIINTAAIDDDNSGHNPLLKVKPLFGYGRIDFNFVLRQAGEFAIRVSIEADDSYFMNGNEDKIMRAFLLPSTAPPASSPATPVPMTPSSSNDSSMYIPTCGVTLASAIGMLKASLDMSAYFVYDSPAAKRQRRFAPSMINPLEMPRPGTETLAGPRSASATPSNGDRKSSSRGALLGGAPSNGKRSTSSSTVPLRDRIVFGPPSTPTSSSSVPTSRSSPALTKSRGNGNGDIISFGGTLPAAIASSSSLPFALDDTSGLGSPLLHGDPVFPTSHSAHSFDPLDDDAMSAASSAAAMDNQVDGDALPSFMQSSNGDHGQSLPPLPPPPPPSSDPQSPMGLGHKRSLDSNDSSILKRGRVGPTASSSVSHGIISFHPPDSPAFALPGNGHGGNGRFGGIPAHPQNHLQQQLQQQQTVPILFRSSAPAGVSGSYQRPMAAPSLLFPSVMSPSPFGNGNGVINTNAANNNNNNNMRVPFSPLMSHSPLPISTMLQPLPSLSAPVSALAPIIPSQLQVTSQMSSSQHTNGRGQPLLRGKRQLSQRSTPTSPRSPNSEADNFLSLANDDPTISSSSSASSSVAGPPSMSNINHSSSGNVASPSSMFMLSSPITDSPPGLEPHGGNTPPHPSTIATVPMVSGSDERKDYSHSNLDVKRSDFVDERADNDNDRAVAILGHKMSPHPVSLKQEGRPASRQSQSTLVPGDATGQVIQLLQKLYLDSAQPLGGARMLPAGDPTSPASHSSIIPTSGALPPGLGGPPNADDPGAPQQLVSTDGRTITLICAHGVWPENTSVYFHFGSKASSLAAGQIDPYKRNQRVFFIPPIPDKVWKSAVEYVRSCSHRFLAITPYITADVVVSSEATDRHPVVGYYTYPQSIPVPTDPSKSLPDNEDRRDEDDDGRGDRDADQDDASRRQLTRGNGGQGDTGSMAGIVITVQQKFFIPYNRLHSLLLYVNADCPISMDSPSALYLARHLVFGMQQLVQSYLDKKLSNMSPSPAQWHSFVASILPYSHLRDTAMGGAYEGPMSPKTATSTIPNHNGAGEMEVDLSVEDLAIFIRRVLADRCMDAMINKTFHIVDSHGLTLAHYLAAYGQFSLCALAGNHGADLLFVSPLSPLFSSTASMSTSTPSSFAPITPLSLLSLATLQHMGLATRVVNNTGNNTPIVVMDTTGSAPLAVAPPAHMMDIVAPTALPAPAPIPQPVDRTLTTYEEYLEIEKVPKALPSPGRWTPLDRDGDHRMGVEMTTLKLSSNDNDVVMDVRNKSPTTHLLPTRVPSGLKWTEATSPKTKQKNSTFINIVTDSGRMSSSSPEPYAVLAVNARPLLIDEKSEAVKAELDGPPSLLRGCPWWARLLALLIVVIGAVLIAYFHITPDTLLDMVEDAPIYTHGGIPAFPGAEGHGSDSPGGRYGPVYRVTTLATSGIGSLQWAVDQPGPRFISFMVSGSIHGDILIKHGSITIAGHTAPGYGITLKGSMLISTQGDTILDDVVIQFLRVRTPSAHSLVTTLPSALQGYRRHAVLAYLATNVIMDHCTFSSSVDSLIHLVRARNITVSWSTLEEPAAGTSTDPDPLPLPTRPSSTSSYHWNTQSSSPPLLRLSTTRAATGTAAISNGGSRMRGFDWEANGILPDDTETAGVIHSAVLTSVNVTHASFHHNLIAHSSRANPQFDGSPVDIRNNVFHDYNQGFTHQAMLGRTLVDESVKGGINIVGNYYQDRKYQGAGVPPLNDSLTNDPALQQYYAATFEYDGAGPAIPWVLAGTDHLYHIRDNYVDGIGHIANPWTTYASWSEAERVKYSRWGLDYATLLGSYADEFRHVNAPVTTHTSSDAYSLVLLEAGTQPRDSTTQRVVLETRKRSGWIGRSMTSPDTPSINITVTDSDSDGIPDDWEIEQGADPYNISDATMIWNNTGYTVEQSAYHIVPSPLSFF
jgi:hypothetical protein